MLQSVKYTFTAKMQYEDKVFSKEHILNKQSDQ